MLQWSCDRAATVPQRTNSLRFPCFCLSVFLFFFQHNFFFQHKKIFHDLSVKLLSFAASQSAGNYFRNATPPSRQILCSLLLQNTNKALFHYNRTEVILISPKCLSPLKKKIQSEFVSSQIWCFLILGGWSWKYFGLNLYQAKSGVISFWVGGPENFFFVFELVSS